MDLPRVIQDSQKVFSFLLEIVSAFDSSANNSLPRLPLRNTDKTHIQKPAFSSKHQFSGTSCTDGEVKLSS